jgi:hypothetical protein
MVAEESRADRSLLHWADWRWCEKTFRIALAERGSDSSWIFVNYKFVWGAAGRSARSFHR